MLKKPRVGLILMQSEEASCSEAQQVLEAIQADTREIVRRLEPIFEIQGPWVVSCVENLHECQQALRETELDMVLLAYQTAIEDVNLVSLLQAIGSRPLVLWCYLPWRRLPRPVSHANLLRVSGPVGAFTALGTLRNLSVPFFFTFGAPDDPRLINDLGVAGRAACARQGLRDARIGLLPSRNEKMQVNLVDEFRLMADLGPVVHYESVNVYKRVVDAVPAEQVQAYLSVLRERFTVLDVTDETLERAAQMALGLASLAVSDRLDMLVVNETSSELDSTFNMSLGLHPDLDGALDVLFMPGGDLGAATANLIMTRMTGGPTMLLELWFWDEAKSHLVGGHGGIQNPAVGDPKQSWISPEYGRVCPGGLEGAQMQMIARPGRVTLFQLRSTPNGWQAIAASGVCLESQPWVEGFPHANVRLDASIEHFLNRVAAVGTSQHWIMGYGSVLHEIEAFCQMENIPLELIRD